MARVLKVPPREFHIAIRTQCHIRMTRGLSNTILIERLTKAALPTTEAVAAKMVLVVNHINRVATNTRVEREEAVLPAIALTNVNNSCKRAIKLAEPTAISCHIEVATKAVQILILDAVTWMCIRLRDREALKAINRLQRIAAPSCEPVRRFDLRTTTVQANRNLKEDR